MDQDMKEMPRSMKDVEQGIADVEQGILDVERGIFDVQRGSNEVRRGSHDVQQGSQEAHRAPLRAGLARSLTENLARDVVSRGSGSERLPAGQPSFVQRLRGDGIE